MSEVSGIVRNGIERGWSLNEIKTSLLNSGYPEQEIDEEIKLLTNNSPAVSQIPQPNITQNKPSMQNLSNYQTLPAEQKASNKMVIAIIILLILCILAGAGFFFFR